ncbi:HalOD1 output domain-containing protein [Halobellus rufus]|uniref:HalOD1 output domain-containing protein n=1 Tax=Halobellus rufus TaxID=1448860 RepID=UPI0018CE13CA|nr:HalOD1 output domain-containing protein [Halobellus rufus]
MKSAQPDCLSDTAVSTNSSTFQFEPERETVVVDIVEAVSAVAGVDPLHFEPRLHDVVDADALVECIQSGGDDVSVSFEMGAYDVTVRGCGEIEVVES